MSMWAKEGTPAGDLFNLISDYFDAGYLEGKEGRSMDTPDRKADRISSAIHEHLQRYAALVERVEELEADEVLAQDDMLTEAYMYGYEKGKDYARQEHDRYREALDWLCQCEELCHWYDYFQCHPMVHELVNWRQCAHIEAYGTRHEAFEEARQALREEGE